jgi:hypothetical protein
VREWRSASLWGAAKQWGKRRGGDAWRWGTIAAERGGTGGVFHVVPGEAGEG